MTSRKATVSAYPQSAGAVYRSARFGSADSTIKRRWMDRRTGGNPSHGYPHLGIGIRNVSDFTGPEVLSILRNLHNTNAFGHIGPRRQRPIFVCAINHRPVWPHAHCCGLFVPVR
jgi:hypothetical protein